MAVVVASKSDVISSGLTFKATTINSRPTLK